MTAAETYESRLGERRAEIGRRLAAERRISWGRLSAIALAIAGAALSFGWLLAGGIAFFVLLVIAHERTIRRRRRLERAADFYAAALDRLSDRWQGKGVSGARFEDPHHPYAADLDLFGHGSLYELLCGAITTAGQSKLASWLKSPSRDVAEIVGRQQAIAELRDAVDLREAMAAQAIEAAEALEPVDLARWSAEPPVGMASWERAAAIVLPLVTVAVGAFVLARAMPLWALLLAAAAQLSFARAVSARVASIVGGVERAEPALAQLAKLLETLARRRFQSERLARIERSIAPHAAAEVERLRRLVGLLDARRNQIFVPVALVLLWTTNLAFLIERWRRVSGRSIGGWIDAVAEVEALSSLASFAFENPGFAVPRLAADGARFLASELGHPLIPASRRVCNDLRLDQERQLLIISGSNMSGKSTLLRSAGVAAVLAFAGAPVCARELEIAPLAVGASIQIHDSLQEGSSRFYAEILRIRQILDLAAEQPPVLFLLDEILHGTNSHDRRIGAEAVVRRLVERGAIGLVSTHDLALAHIAESLAPRAANVHFEDQIVDGKVAFDYRMRAGVVQKSNALELMRSVGIEI